MHILPIKIGIDLCQRPFSEMEIEQIIVTQFQ